jgi:hypothetical protein
MFKSQRYFRIFFRAYFHQKNFQKEVGRKFIRVRIRSRNRIRIRTFSKVGPGFGRFRKSDPDPVKIRPDPQNCFEATVRGFIIQRNKLIDATNSLLNLCAFYLYIRIIFRGFVIFLFSCSHG